MSRLAKLFWLVGASVLPLAACGGDDDTSGTGGTSTGGGAGTGAAGSGGSGASSTGGSSTGGSGGSAGTAVGGNGGATCGPSGGSCITQECCTGLQCCVGTPIPPNEAICYTECPKSDRNIKRDFEPVDPADVLERVSKLPISTWSYKSESPSVRHIGPMAQDFKATFDVGGSDRTILQVDGDGVALASIQALRTRLLKVEAENEALKRSLKALESKVEARTRR